MPRETEADRIIRKQLRAREEAKQNQARIAWEVEVGLYNDYMTRMKTELPAVLKLLKQQGYPNAQPITVEKKSSWLDVGKSFEVKAGWEIATRYHEGNAEYPPHTTAYYILSDGRFASSSGEVARIKDLEKWYNPRVTSLGFTNMHELVGIYSNGLHNFYQRLLNPQNLRRP